MKKSSAFSLSIQPASNVLPETLTQELEASLGAQDYDRALEVIDAAPRMMKNQPEFKLMRAIMLAWTGNEAEALRILREVERKSIRFMEVYLPLALLYMDRDWPAHALQAAKRGLTDSHQPEENRSALQLVVDQSTASVQQAANELELSFDVMLRAGTFNEQAQMAMGEDRLAETEFYTREAIKLAPNWNPPHNNRARALYFSGKTAEAITVSEGVLERDADNIFALGSLVTYHLGLGQPEQAQVYASRLVALWEKLPSDSLEMEHIISALAAVEDTAALWAIARRYLSAPGEVLFARSWHCLSVAAVRSGKWKDALRLLKKANDRALYPSAKNLLDELEALGGQPKPRLAWMPPAYPGVDLFLHPKVMAEWEDLLGNFSDTLTASQKRKLNNFLQKYPFVVAAIKRMLWDKETNEAAIQLLAEMEMPEADAEILHFALSQAGDQDSRLRAIMYLIETGRYTGPKRVNLWIDDREEWHEVELNTQRIGEIEMDAKPQTMALIEKAQKAKSPEEAIALLRKAVEAEPTSPIAVFNLGVMLAQNGQAEEGNELIRQSVTIAPNYTYGHASIALTEAEARNERTALDHLEFVSRAPVIAPNTAVIANLAWLVLAIDKRDLKSARQRYEMAAQLIPDHPMLKHYESLLKEAEEYNEQYGFILDYQRESAQRSHKKLLKAPLTAEMGLRACLEMYTKEMLMGSAHFVGTSISGKKAELADRLAEALSDESLLQQIVEEALHDDERGALKWLLEANGIRPWKEFVPKYGDDMDESVLWNYHEPKSIPGRLRAFALLYTGTLEDQQVALIPVDLRAPLKKLLK